MILARLAIGTAITAIGMFGADNSLGTWRRNIAKSKVNTPISNPITSLTLVNEPSAGGVKQTVSGVRKDNGAIKSTFTAKYDGKEYPVIGASWDRISMKQVDANTFTVEMKNSRGKYHVS